MKMSCSSSDYWKICSLYSLYAFDYELTQIYMVLFSMHYSLILYSKFLLRMPRPQHYIWLIIYTWALLASSCYTRISNDRQFENEWIIRYKVPNGFEFINVMCTFFPPIQAKYVIRARSYPFDIHIYIYIIPSSWIKNKWNSRHLVDSSSFNSDCNFRCETLKM